MPTAHAKRLAQADRSGLAPLPPAIDVSPWLGPTLTNRLGTPDLLS
jgi:hypothetical protein